MKCSPLMARKSPRTPSRWLQGILVSLVLSTGLVDAAYALGPAAAALPGQLSLQDGKLTARLIATPLRQVMEEVSRLSGARVRWLSSQAAEKPVSVGFTALPLPEALRRILGETNFLLFYAPGGEGTTLTQIWISSKGTGGGQPGFPPRLATQAPLSPASDSQSENAVEGQAGLTAMPVDVLIQTAVGAEDTSLRVEAIAQLGEYAPADPKVKEILSHLASNDSNPQVRASAAEVLAGME